MPQTAERQVAIALPSMSPKLTYENAVNRGTLHLNLLARLVWDLHASSIAMSFNLAFILTEADFTVNAVTTHVP